MVLGSFLRFDGQESNGGKTLILRKFLSQLRALAGVIHGRRIFGGPIQANLTLANRCNLKCIHCYYHSPLLERPNYRGVRLARQINEQLPDDGYFNHQKKITFNRKGMEKILDELIKSGVYRFFLSGNGEPFLNKYSIDIMKKIKKANCYCLVKTNGTLLSKKITDELIHMKFDELHITTMAGNRDMYIRTHSCVPQETFDSVKNNLLYLAEQKKKLHTNKPQVSLIYVVISENYSGLYDFAEFAYKVQADRVFIQPVDEMGDTGLKRLVLTEKQTEYVREEAVKLKNYFKSKKIKHNIDKFLKIFSAQLDTREVYRLIPCYYAWLSVLIDIDGNVYPCYSSYRSMGNIYENSFNDIWNSEHYRLFREKSLKLNCSDKSDSICDYGNCPHYTANMKLHKMIDPVKKVFSHNYILRNS
jgi:radical SAM protein with 4Fe4S-binding SPASM domain